MEEYIELLETNKDVLNFFGKYPIVGSSLRVTMGCNAKCKHCYTMGGRKLENEFTTEQIIKIIDQLSDLNIAQMFFTGGEPFLRPDIVEILNYANDKGIDIMKGKISCIGNIMYDNIQDIKDKITNFKLSYDKTECRDCKYGYICRGGCRTKIFAANNDLYEKGTRCKEMYKFIEMIKI